MGGLVFYSFDSVLQSFCHHSCEICCGMICHCCSHWEGSFNFERVPLSFKEPTSPKERERERSKRKGRGREVCCLWIIIIIMMIIIRGSLIFLGRFFGRLEKRIQALNRPDIFLICEGSLKLIWAVDRVQWTWQFSKVAFAIWQLGNLCMAIKQQQLPSWTSQFVKVVLAK